MRQETSVIKWTEHHRCQYLNMYIDSIHSVHDYRFKLTVAASMSLNMIKGTNISLNMIKGTNIL